MRCFRLPYLVEPRNRRESPPVETAAAGQCFRGGKTRRFSRSALALGHARCLSLSPSVSPLVLKRGLRRVKVDRHSSAERGRAEQHGSELGDALGTGRRHRASRREAESRAATSRRELIGRARECKHESGARPLRHGFRPRAPGQVGRFSKIVAGPGRPRANAATAGGRRTTADWREARGSVVARSRKGYSYCAEDGGGRGEGWVGFWRYFSRECCQLRNRVLRIGIDD